MLVVLGQVLPFAVAGALSSVPVVAVLTLLLARPGRLPAVLFACGYVVGVFGVTLAAQTLFRSALVPPRHVGAEPGIGVAEIVLGVACVAVAVVPRRRATGTPRAAALLTRVLGTVPPAVTALLGVALAFRAKALLLASGVGMALASAHLAFAQDLALLAFDAVATASTVAVPIALAFGRSDGGRVRLEAVRAWIARNARTVTVVVLLLIGAVLVGDGLGRF